MTPKVTVHFTSYNQARFLRQSIDSVLNQTFSDFEFVITDDCSTDESREIIRSYTDPRIVVDFPDKRYMRQHGDTVTQMAKGEYVAIQHSDDVWLPEKLAKQVAFLDRNQEYGAIFSHAHIINEQGEQITHQLQEAFTQPNRNRFEWLRFFFFNGNALCHPSVLMRKNVAVECFPNYALTGLPDLYKWIKLCLQQYELHILQEPLVQFRYYQDLRSEGANSRTNRNRFFTECQWFLRLYRTIGPLEAWLKVFPEANGFIVNGECDTDFVLAQMCLQSIMATSAYSNFALLLLFELMENKETRERLERLYNFTTLELAELTKTVVIFPQDSPTCPPTVGMLLLDFGDGFELEKALHANIYPAATGEYTVQFNMTLPMLENKRRPLKKILYFPRLKNMERHRVISGEIDGVSIQLHAVSLDTSLEQGSLSPIHIAIPPEPRGRTVRISGVLRENQ